MLKKIQVFCIMVVLTALTFPLSGTTVALGDMSTKEAETLAVSTTKGYLLQKYNMNEDEFRSIFGDDNHPAVFFDYISAEHDKIRLDRIRVCWIPHNSKGLDPYYQFEFIVDANTMELYAYTDPLLIEQFRVQMDTGEYPEMFNANLLEREMSWGPCWQWSYEQIYNFQQENYGIGILGHGAVYGLPTASSIINFSDAMRITREEYRKIYATDIDNDGCVVISRYIRGCQYVICNEAKMRDIKPYWVIYVISNDHLYEVLSLIVYSESARVYVLNSEQISINMSDVLFPFEF